MSTGNLIAYVVIPLTIFFLSALGGGVLLLIKAVNYFTKSREAQESTAKTVAEIAEQLRTFITSAGERLNNHGERIAVLEDRTEVRK
jgi:hypothetical protein